MYSTDSTVVMPTQSFRKYVFTHYFKISIGTSI